MLSTEEFRCKDLNNGLLQFKDKVYTGRFLRVGLISYEEKGEVINIPNEEALRKIANDHMGVPVIINHTTLTKDNIKYEKVGTVADVFINDKGFVDGKGKSHPADGWAWCNFVITDSGAVNLLENEKWELSNSYIPTTKNSNNFHADKDVVDGVGLHLAIVQKGRYDTKVVFNNSKIINTNIMQKAQDIISNAVNKLKAIGKEISTENTIVENSTAEGEKVEAKKEKTDNMCGKKYENKNFKLDNGDVIPVEMVMNALKDYKKQEEEKAKEKEALENSIASLEDEYDIEGEKMSGKEMMELYQSITKKDTKEKESAKDNQIEIEVKEEDKEEEEDKEKTEKKEVMDNSIVNNQSTFFQSQLNDIKNNQEPNETLKAINNSAITTAPAEKKKIASITLTPEDYKNL